MQNIFNQRLKGLLPKSPDQALVDLCLELFGLTIVYYVMINFLIIYLSAFGLYLFLNILYLLFCVYMGHRLAMKVGNSTRYSVITGMAGTSPLLANIGLLMHFYDDSNRELYSIFDLSGLAFKLVSRFGESYNLGESFNVIFHLALIPLAIMSVIAGSRLSPGIKKLSGRLLKKANRGSMGGRC